MSSGRDTKQQQRHRLLRYVQGSIIKEIWLSLGCGLNWVNEVHYIWALQFGIDSVELFRSPPVNLLKTLISQMFRERIPQWVNIIDIERVL